MRRIIKGILNRTWKPYLKWYLRRPRNYSYHDISIKVLPHVFHPGFFFSTNFLIYFLKKIDLNGKKFLEMGSGTGLVSIVAAKRGADVIAAELSPLAISCTKENAQRNNVNISIIESDLFNSIPAQKFDIITVNPPYFKKNPVSMEEKTWYCGEKLDYFSLFFQQAIPFVHPDSVMIMVLSDECDLSGIQLIAEKYHWQWELVLEKRRLWEKNFIFYIRPTKGEMF